MQNCCDVSVCMKTKVLKPEWQRPVCMAGVCACASLPVCVRKLVCGRVFQRDQSAVNLPWVNEGQMNKINVHSASLLL